MLYALRNVWPPYCAWPEHVAHVVALYYGYEQWSKFGIYKKDKGVGKVLHHAYVCQLQVHKARRALIPCSPKKVDLCGNYMSSCEYAVMPFCGLCISYSDRIYMCHPIGQFHKTGMDELGYRRVFLCI